jgi:hypothetical protein
MNCLARSCWRRGRCRGAEVAPGRRALCLRVFHYDGGDPKPVSGGGRVRAAAHAGPTVGVAAQTRDTPLTPEASLMVRDALERLEVQNGGVRPERLPPDFFTRISREFLGNPASDRPKVNSSRASRGNGHSAGLQSLAFLAEASGRQPGR